ncbi:MAG: hypothetical protein RR022_02775 [Angelakisella sp.]
MKQKWIALVAAACLLTAGCGGSPAPAATEALTNAAASALVKSCEDVIWLYHGEMKVNKKATPYADASHKLYLPCLGYDSIDALKTASEQVLSKSFCENVLYAKAFDPANPKFIEHEGKLWETRSVGGMGWVNSLLLDTMQVLSQDQDKALATAYAQSQVDGLFREEFTFIQEGGGWRLDSYFKMNRTGAEPVIGATVADYLRGEGAVRWQGDVIISAAHSATVELTKQELRDPFYDVLEGLEYNTETVENNAEWPNTLDENGGGIELEVSVGDSIHQVMLFKNGDVFVRDTGKPAARLQLSYPSGYWVIEQLVSAAKWELFRKP